MNKRVYEHVSLNKLPEHYRKIAKGGPHNGLYYNYQPGFFLFFFVWGLLALPIGLLGYYSVSNALLSLIGLEEITLMDTYIGGTMGIVSLGVFIVWAVRSLSKLTHQIRQRRGVYPTGLYILPEALFFHFSGRNNWIIPRYNMKDVRFTRIDSAGSRPVYLLFLVYLDNDYQPTSSSIDLLSSLNTPGKNSLGGVIKLWIKEPEKAIQAGISGNMEDLPEIS